MNFEDFLNKKITIDKQSILNWINFKSEYPHLHIVRYLKKDIKDISIIKVNKQRKPRSTDESVFALLNWWLSRNRHNRRDESVNCYFSNKWTPEKTLHFGVRYPIIPKGKFSYTFVKAHDLNESYSNKDKFKYEYLLWNFRYIIKPFLKYFPYYSEEDSINFLKKINKGTNVLNSAFTMSQKENIQIIENANDDDILITENMAFHTIEDFKNNANDLSPYFITNKMADLALKNDYEVWINCNEFYALTKEKYDNLLVDLKL